MIVFNRVILENFMSVSHSEMTFEKDSITSITGKNGSGKSTLLYALALAITGYKKSATYKDYVKAEQGTARVYVEASLEGYPILYDLSIDESSGALERNVDYKGVHYHNSDYEAFIKEYKLDQLENTMFVFSKEKSITNAKPSERAEMLKKLFKFEFDGIVEKLKENLEETKVSITETKAILEELNKRTFDIQPLMRAKPAKAIQEEREKLSEVIESLATLQTVSKEAVSNNLTELRKASASISDITSKIEFYKNQMASVKNEIDEKERYIAAHPLASEKEKLGKMNAELSKLKEVHAHSQGEASRINADIRLLRAKIKELEEQIAIGMTGICHACGQPVDEEHVKETEAKRTQALESLKKAEEENALYDLDKESKQIRELEMNIKSQERIVDKVESEGFLLTNARLKLKDIEGNITDREKLLEDVKASREKLLLEKARLETLSPLLAQKDELEAQKKSLEIQIEEDLKGIAVLQEKIENNRKLEAEKQERDRRVAELGETINTLTKNVNTLKTEIEIYEKAFPNFCIMRACESIQKYLNTVVQKLFPYMQIKLSTSNRGKGVDFFFTSEASPTKFINAKMASGAQEQILNLAYAIAVAQSCGLQTILLDEVDAAMDDENCGLIYEFVTSLEGFTQVIAISHRSESLEVAKRHGAVAYYVNSGEYQEA